MTKDIVTSMRHRYLLSQLKEGGFTDTSLQTLLLMDHSFTLFFSHILQVLKNETLHAGRSRTTILDILKCKQFEKNQKWIISQVLQMRKEKKTIQTKNQYINRYASDDHKNEDISILEIRKKRMRVDNSPHLKGNVENKLLYNEREFNKFNLDHSKSNYVSDKFNPELKEDNAGNRIDHMPQLDEHGTDNEFNEQEGTIKQVKYTYGKHGTNLEGFEQFPGLQKDKSAKEFMLATPIDKYVHIYEHLPSFPASHTFRRTIIKPPIDFSCSNLKKRIEQSLRAENNLFKMKRGRKYINFLYHNEHDCE